MVMTGSYHSTNQCTKQRLSSPSFHLSPSPQLYIEELRQIYNSVSWVFLNYSGAWRSGKGSSTKQILTPVKSIVIINHVHHLLPEEVLHYSTARGIAEKLHES